MQKQVVDDIHMNPDTGELEFTFKELEVEKSPTPDSATAQDPAPAQNFAPSIETAEKRYKAVQGWATKVHQRNLDLEKRFSALEARLRNASQGPRATLPEGEDPGVPDLDRVLSDPNQLRSYIDAAVKSSLGLVGQYLKQELQPYRQMLTAYNTHNELQQAVNSHDDFVHWQPEILEISKSLPDDKDMTLEELYYEARARNPEKAMQIDSGEYRPGADQSNAAEPAQTQTGVQQTPSTESGTEQQVPDDPSNPARRAPYDPRRVSVSDFPDRGVATAEELQRMADRHTTETGVADGSSPEPVHQGLDAALEAAYAEMTAGT